MDIKLRACPFCGGEAKLVKNARTAQIVCKKCSNRTLQIVMSVDKCATTEAAKLWNRRVVDVRVGRPYDAMGDDQGRGFTADDWYRDEFASADVYKGKDNE